MIRVENHHLLCGQAEQDTKSDTTEAECVQSAVAKHIDGQLSGRQTCAGKWRTIQTDYVAWRGWSGKGHSKMEELLKEWTEAGVGASSETC